MLSIVDDEGNEVLLIDVDLKDLSSFADTDNTRVVQGFSSHKDQRVS